MTSTQATKQMQNYLIDGSLSVYRLKDTLSNHWSYWKEHLDLPAAVVVGEDAKTSIPISPDGRLVPGQLYPASIDSNMMFYLPSYRLHEEAGRFSVSLKWNVDQKPDAPLAFLAIDLEAIIPSISPNIQLKEIQHKAVLRLGYRLPIQASQNEYSSTLWVDLGALQSLDEAGMRRCVRELHDKAEFDRLYAVMSNPDFDAFLEIRYFATVGHRTWRQVILGNFDFIDQPQILVEKSLQVNNLFNMSMLQTQKLENTNPNLNLLNMEVKDVGFVGLNQPLVFIKEPGVTSLNANTPVAQIHNPNLANLRLNPSTMQVQNLEVANLNPTTNAVHLENPAVDTLNLRSSVVNQQNFDFADKTYLASVKPPIQVPEDAMLKVSNQEFHKLVIPIRTIRDKQGEPALISVAVESTYEIRSFHFSVETNAYIFDLPDDLRPNRSPVLLRFDIIDDDGTLLGVFYGDSSQSDQFYCEPQEFRLARKKSAPYLPELRIVFFNEIIQQENQRSLNYRVELAYRALPYIDPKVLALARQHAQSLCPQPRFTSLLPENTTLSLRLPIDDRDGDLIEALQNEAEVNFQLGIIDQVELSSQQFERICAAFQSLTTTGLEGKVQATITGSTKAHIPLRLSLKETCGEVLTATYRGPVSGDPSLHRVEIFNHIESPVTIEALHPVSISPGIVAFPLSDPGKTLTPGETTELEYQLPPDSTVLDINPSLTTSVQVDAAKMLPKFFENGGYSTDIYSINILTEDSFFGITPPAAPGPLMALQISFDDAPTITLSKDMLKTAVTLPVPLLNKLQIIKDSIHYRYRITNVYANGETMALGNSSDWLDGISGVDLFITPVV